MMTPLHHTLPPATSSTSRPLAPNRWLHLTRCLLTLAMWSATQRRMAPLLRVTAGVIHASHVRALDTTTPRTLLHSAPASSPHALPRSSSIHLQVGSPLLSPSTTAPTPSPPESTAASENEQSEIARLERLIRERIDEQKRLLLSQLPPSSSQPPSSADSPPTPATKESSQQRNRRLRGAERRHRAEERSRAVSQPDGEERYQQLPVHDADADEDDLAVPRPARGSAKGRQSPSRPAAATADAIGDAEEQEEAEEEGYVGDEEVNRGVPAAGVGKKGARGPPRSLRERHAAHARGVKEVPAQQRSTAERTAASAADTDGSAYAQRSFDGRYGVPRDRGSPSSSNAPTSGSRQHQQRDPDSAAAMVERITQARTQWDQDEDRHISDVHTNRSEYPRRRPRDERSDSIDRPHLSRGPQRGRGAEDGLTRRGGPSARGDGGGFAQPSYRRGGDRERPQPRERSYAVRGGRGRRDDVAWTPPRRWDIRGADGQQQRGGQQRGSGRDAEFSSSPRGGGRGRGSPRDDGRRSSRDGRSGREGRWSERQRDDAPPSRYDAQGSSNGRSDRETRTSPLHSRRERYPDSTVHRNDRRGAQFERFDESRAASRGGAAQFSRERPGRDRNSAPRRGRHTYR